MQDVSDPSPTEGLRRRLRASVVDSAAPYGYTLTIFANGSVAGYIIGKPHGPEEIWGHAHLVSAGISVLVPGFAGHRMTR
jgi:hypothetical protein